MQPLGASLPGLEPVMRQWCTGLSAQNVLPDFDVLLCRNHVQATQKKLLPSVFPFLMKTARRALTPGPPVDADSGSGEPTWSGQGFHLGGGQTLQNPTQDEKRMCAWYRNEQLAWGGQTIRVRVGPPQKHQTRGPVRKLGGVGAVDVASLALSAGAAGAGPVIVIDPRTKR